MLVAMARDDPNCTNFIAALERAATDEKFARRVRVAFVDVDAQPEFAEALRVESIPVSCVWFYVLVYTHIVVSFFPRSHDDTT